MQVTDLFDAEGRVFAFEVNNLYICRGNACGVLSGIPGARTIREPKFFSFLREEVFCEVELDGVTFIA